MPQRSLHRRLAAEDGFSIVEVLVAAVVLVVGLLGTLTIVDTATTTTFQTKSREQATALQRELIEAVRAVPYEQVAPASLAASVRSRDALSDPQGSAGWTVRRRGTTYTVALSACVVDDPRDGSGSHEAGSFCDPAAEAQPASGCQALLDATPSATAPAKVAGSAGTSAQRGACGIDADLDGTVDGLVAAAATTCAGTGCGTKVDTTPADYRRVVSLVRWEAGETRRSVLMVTTLPNPGLSAAPAVTSLDPSGGAVVTAATTTALNFTALTSPAPAAVVWYVDGAQQGSASGSGNTWSFTWTFGPATAAVDGAQPGTGEKVDGSYVVGAKAFDRYGQSGAPRSRTILLNRSRPFAPRGALAGRNGTAVEIEWSPNRERDLRGYRVYRLPATGSAVLACSLTVALRCRDASPPVAGDVRYVVVAVDLDPNGLEREGDQSAVAVATDANRPPNPPATLQATASGADVVLVWPKPSPADPDEGDAIDHYNIYRDGQVYEARYDRTGTGDDLTYTDRDAGGAQHTYYITAVDRHLAESIMVGAVSGG